MTPEQRQKLQLVSYRVPGDRRLLALPLGPARSRREYTEAEKRVFVHLSICKRCDQSQTQRGGCRGRCPCHVDGKDIVIHAMTDCPLGKYLESADLKGEMDELLIRYSKRAMPAWRTRGPELWAMLHRWAIGYDVAAGWATTSLVDWLAGFERLIVCGECRAHWRDWVAANPPDARHNDALLRWTIAGHNAVNRRLNKPEMAEEVAVAYWINEGAAKSV